MYCYSDDKSSAGSVDEEMCDNPIYVGNNVASLVPVGPAEESAYRKVLNPLYTQSPATSTGQLSSTAREAGYATPTPRTPQSVPEPDLCNKHIQYRMNKDFALH